jgi:hypothetical protein
MNLNSHKAADFNASANFSPFSERKCALNMEIYAHTLQSNITTDVKKKKGEAPSSVEIFDSNITSKRNAKKSDANVHANDIFSLFSERCARNMKIYTHSLHGTITTDVKKKKGRGASRPKL